MVGQTESEAVSENFATEAVESRAPESEEWMEASSAEESM